MLKRWFHIFFHHFFSTGKIPASLWSIPNFFLHCFQVKKKYFFCFQWSLFHQKFSVFHWRKSNFFTQNSPIFHRRKSNFSIENSPIFPPKFSVFRWKKSWLPIFQQKHVQRVEWCFLLSSVKYKGFFSFRRSFCLMGFFRLFFFISDWMSIWIETFRFKWFCAIFCDFFLADRVAATGERDSQSGGHVGTAGTAALPRKVHLRGVCRGHGQSRRGYLSSQRPGGLERHQGGKGTEAEGKERKESRRGERKWKVGPKTNHFPSFLMKEKIPHACLFVLNQCTLFCTLTLFILTQLTMTPFCHCLRWMPFHPFPWYVCVVFFSWKERFAELYRKVEKARQDREEKKKKKEKWGRKMRFEEEEKNEVGKSYKKRETQSFDRWTLIMKFCRFGSCCNISSDLMERVCHCQTFFTSTAWELAPIERRANSHRWLLLTPSSFLWVKNTHAKDLLPFFATGQKTRARKEKNAERKEVSEVAALHLETWTNFTAFSNKNFENIIYSLS